MAPGKRGKTKGKKKWSPESIWETLTSETARNTVLVLVLLAILILLSGIVYSLTSENAISIAFLRGGAIRVFLWTLNAQTHAETLVIFIYYLLGIAGLWLYINATTRPFNPKNTKYMLFFSFILLLLAGLGLYNAFVSKFQPPT